MYSKLYYQILEKQYILRTTIQEEIEQLTSSFHVKVTHFQVISSNICIKCNAMSRTQHTPCSIITYASRLHRIAHRQWRTVYPASCYQ